MGELKNLLMNGAGRGIIGYVGNPKGMGSPRLIKMLAVSNRGGGGGLEGPVGGSDDPNRYWDDPERGRGRGRNRSSGVPVGGTNDPGRYSDDPERGRDR